MKENDGHVIVLMAVYNGEKYVKQQLESIYNQTYGGRITVCVRDDGSADGTSEKILGVKRPKGRALVLRKGKNLGPAGSFLRLIQTAGEADWYFYSDQDDVWAPDKVEQAVKQMRRAGETPILYGCNYSLCDENLTPVKRCGIESKPQLTPLKMLFYNKIPGCCMGMNRALMDRLKEMKLTSVMMHDSMTLCYALYAGGVVYDKEPKVFHRIHADNVVGLGHRKIVPLPWLKEKLLLLRRKEDYDISKMASEFLRVTEDARKLPYYNDIVLLKNYKKNLRNTLQLLNHKDTKDAPLDRTTMSIRSKIFFRLF